MPSGSELLPEPSSTTLSISAAIELAIAFSITEGAFDASSSNSIEIGTMQANVFGLNVTLSKTTSLAVTAEPSGLQVLVGSVVNRTNRTSPVIGNVWDTQIRFLGIGAMVVAGVYSIIKIAGSMGAAARSAFRGLRGLEDTASLPRTEQSITGRALFGLLDAR